MRWFEDRKGNTKFFHARVNSKRKILQINMIQRDNGMWIKNKKELAEEVVN